MNRWAVVKTHALIMGAHKVLLKKIGKVRISRDFTSYSVTKPKPKKVNKKKKEKRGKQIIQRVSRFNIVQLKQITMSPIYKNHLAEHYKMNTCIHNHKTRYQRVNERTGQKKKRGGGGEGDNDWMHHQIKIYVVFFISLLTPVVN